jgi:hypothetical protein
MVIFSAIIPKRYLDPKDATKLTNPEINIQRIQVDDVLRISSKSTIIKEKRVLEIRIPKIGNKHP